MREGPTIIAVCPVTPVRVSLRGLDSEGAWSSDPLVAQERQRQGLGESLLRTWDRQSGVALGASLSDGTRFLLEKIRWPKAVTLPCLVKPLSRRAFRQPSWPVAINRFVSALALPLVKVVARAGPLREEVDVVRRFDRGIDRLWERVAPRLDLAVQRGCDGVEPDNVTGYDNDTGFGLSARDQLAFNRNLANEAHKRGLFIALKNDGDQAAQLVDYFDLELNEQCHEYDECDTLRVFSERGKPILNAEYASSLSAANNLARTVCPRARAAQIRTLILHTDLDDRLRVNCF